jgi:hypothetical protein
VTSNLEILLEATEQESPRAYARGSLQAEVEERDAV